jgi:hypothetical protein
VPVILDQHRRRHHDIRLNVDAVLRGDVRAATNQAVVSDDQGWLAVTLWGRHCVKPYVFVDDDGIPDLN